MPKCPNCDEYYTHNKEGRCPRCGYNTEGDHYPPPPPRYSTYSYPPPPPGYSTFTAPRTKIDIGETLSLTVDILTKNFLAIFTFLLIPIIIVSAINILSSWAMISALEGLTAGEMDEEAFGAFINYLFTIYLVVIPLTMVIWMIEFLFAGGIVGMTKEGFEGRPVKVNTGFDVIKRNPLGIIGASVVLTLIFYIGSFICFIIALLFCYFWLFTLPIIVIEGKGISAAMSSSKDFAKEHDTAGFTIVVIIIVIVLSMIGGVIGMLLSGTFFILLEFNIEEMFVFGPRLMIGQVIGSIFSVITTAFAIMCAAVHYLRGRDSYMQKVSMPGYFDYPPPPPPPPPASYYDDKDTYRR